ncbi:hypothetical protein JMN32_02535 [Fulvivirga sp. 29W222]|uniref:Uncharacterized protein n=1 Tax=Fulvivirga marina TaxID=2494733 RepID=A0A937FUE8_9BACT|nr:hypothetical protein [Fulvivirga marina]MBL6445168.1 hypothetical protein [Fulvivirga marina]
MVTSNPRKDLLNHSFRLRYKTCDLKSKLTALILYVEECDDLDEEKKQEIMRICNVIAQRNNDLIKTECVLIETLKELLPGADNCENNSMLTTVA